MSICGHGLAGYATSNPIWAGLRRAAYRISAAKGAGLRCKGGVSQLYTACMQGVPCTLSMDYDYAEVGAEAGRDGHTAIASGYLYKLARGGTPLSRWHRRSVFN